MTIRLSYYILYIIIDGWRNRVEDADIVRCVNEWVVKFC